MSFDIGNAPDVGAQEEAGTRINLKDAAGDEYTTSDGEPVTALIAGTYSHRYTRAKTALLDKALKRSGTRSAADVEAAQLKLDATLVIEWDLVSNGQPVSAESIFATQPHIREQVVAAAQDHARFFTTASPTR